MSKKSTTNSSQTSNTTSNATQTPTNPLWVDQGVQGLAGQATGLAGQDPSSFVAGADPLQTQAGAAAAGLTGTPWNYDAALGITGGVANEASPDIASLMPKFQDPWTNQVVKSSLNDFDQNAGQTRAANQLALAGDSTFGGSGGAIQTSQSNDAIDRARATLDSGLRSQGFSTALQGATSQAGLDSQTQAQRLAAGGQMASIADAFGANQRANIGAQSDIGSILQQIAQQKAGAPINTLGSISSIFDGLPLSLEHGQTVNGATTGNQTGSSTTTSSDPMGSLGSLAMGLGALGFAPFTGGASLAGVAGGLGAAGKLGSSLFG